MPELPEVETVRLGLESSVIGRLIHAAEVTGRRTVRRQSPAELCDRLVGRELLAARRRGKYLLIDLDDGSVLVVHLRMSGQLVLTASDAPLAAHTHARLDVGDGLQLRFVDPRTFGELFVTGELDARGAPLELAKIGVDPIVDGIDAKLLGGLLARRKVALKAFLLDQSAICGIGNIYADEICFQAKVSPLRRTDTLRPIELKRIAASIDEVLSAAVAAKGSTLRDARYRDLTGGLGSYQDQHAVYDRGGQPCTRCGKAIVRTRVAGRSAHYCPRCQR